MIGRSILCWSTAYNRHLENIYNIFGRKDLRIFWTICERELFYFELWLNYIWYYVLKFLHNSATIWLYPPHNLEHDVTEEEVVTSVVPSPAVSNYSCSNIKDTPNVSNERKRQRAKTTIPPMSVDISDLPRLADHVHLDKNKFGILSVLADIDLLDASPAINHQTQINDDDQQPAKWYE